MQSHWLWILRQSVKCKSVKKKKRLKCSLNSSPHTGLFHHHYMQQQKDKSMKCCSLINKLISSLLLSAGHEHFIICFISLRLKRLQFNTGSDAITLIDSSLIISSGDQNPGEPHKSRWRRGNKLAQYQLSRVNEVKLVH